MYPCAADRAGAAAALPCSRRPALLLRAVRGSGLGYLHCLSAPLPKGRFRSPPIHTRSALKRGCSITAIGAIIPKRRRFTIPLSIPDTLRMSCGQTTTPRMCFSQRFSAGSCTTWSATRAKLPLHTYGR